VVKIELELEAMGALSFQGELRQRLFFFKHFASSHFARMRLAPNSGIEGPRERKNGKKQSF
jgi:hypothetical protein